MDPNQASTNTTAGSGKPFTTTEHTTTTTHTTRGDGTTNTGTGQGVGGQIKGAVAAVHGMGEAFRGAFNSKIDQMGGDNAGYAKDKAVETKGLSEIEQRKLAHGHSGIAGVQSSTGYVGGAPGSNPPGVSGTQGAPGVHDTQGFKGVDAAYGSQEAGVPGGSSGAAGSGAGNIRQGGVSQDASLGKGY